MSFLKDVVKTNSLEAWERLLSFAPTHLYAPSRGGKRRSLATTINKQLDNENGPPESLIHAQERRRQRSHDSPDLWRARFLVSSRLEEGDFRGAVKLYSFHYFYYC